MTEPIEAYLRNQAQAIRALHRNSPPQPSGPAIVAPVPAGVTLTFAVADRLADFIAAARRWDDHLPGCGMWRHEVERVGTLLICEGRDTLVVDEDCTCGYETFRAALSALDKETANG